MRYFGDYELLEEIGRGGMGVVLRARQMSLKRPVAVKMILTGQLASEADVRRFHAEAEAAANLDHPNIVAIYEVGEHQGQHYFSMQLVEGEDLATRMSASERPLASSAAAGLVAKVARAVHYAHRRGILHRDLKPANVLLDAKGEPHVTDFGLAKRLGRRGTVTLSESTAGTPSFMAPEQASGKAPRPTTAVDIYSLGAILYYLLTKRPPFGPAMLLETLRRVAEEEPARPSALNQGIDRDVETICLKCLEKDPNHRYGSAEALAEDFKRWLRHEPIRARRVTLFERGIKWARRKPTVAGLLVGLALVAALGSAGVAWQSRQAKKERKRAEENFGRMQIHRAEALLEAQNPAPAVACLAQVLRENPSDRVAAGRLVSVLTCRNFGLPVALPINVAHSSAHALRMNLNSSTFDVAGQRMVLQVESNSVCVWDADTGQPLPTALKHRGAVNSARLSPDGESLVTASSDHTAILWDARTGAPLFEPLKHTEAVLFASFSPNGLLVVTVCRDTTARVWSARTGRPLADPLKHDGVVTFARFSPGAERLITGWGERVARVWDTRTGALAWETRGHTGAVTDAQFSPDGQRVITASQDSTARIWDASTGRLLIEPLFHQDQKPAPSSRSQGVTSAKFSPDSTRVLTVCAYSTVAAGGPRYSVHLWDVVANPPAPTLLVADGEPCPDLSPDGQRVVTANDTTARIWNGRTADQLRQPLLHDGQVFSAVFSPDGQWIATVSQDKTARVWDAQTGQPISQPLRHAAAPFCARFTGDGRRLVTVSAGHVMIWNVQFGQALSELFQQPRGKSPAVSDIEFSPDGRQILTACLDNAARLWDARGRKPLDTAFSHSGPIAAVQFSPDGGQVLTASADQTARVWDARSGRALVELRQHEGPVRCARFSPDGKLVVTGCADWAARIWDARTGRLVAPPLKHAGEVNALAFSPEGQRLVTASADQTARIWDSHTGRALTEPLRHDGRVASAQFSPDGRVLATASWDKTARLWDARTGRPLTEPLRHDDAVNGARFSPDGKRLVTASDNKTARVWDASSGHLLTPPLRHRAEVKAARFSPDGGQVLTTCWGSLRLWDAQTGQPLTDSLTLDVRCVEFDPAGQWLIVGCYSGLRRLEIPAASVPVPGWLPELAEAIAGQRLPSERTVQPAPLEEFFRLRGGLSASLSSDPYTRWAKWLLADRRTRALSPASPLTLPEYIQQREQEKTWDGLYEAVREVGCYEAVVGTRHAAAAGLVSNALATIQIPGIANTAEGGASPDPHWWMTAAPAEARLTLPMRALKIDQNSSIAPWTDKKFNWASRDESTLRQIDPGPPPAYQNDDSGWISFNHFGGAPGVRGDAPYGYYTYTLSFDLTGFRPDSAVIKGRWWSDNSSKLRINQADVDGLIEPPEFAPQHLGKAFDVPAKLLHPGTNTLTFEVLNEWNELGTTGLRVDFSQATAEPAASPADNKR